MIGEGCEYESISYYNYSDSRKLLFGITSNGNSFSFLINHKKYDSYNDLLKINQQTTLVSID
jgi:hypothetical protein